MLKSSAGVPARPSSAYFARLGRTDLQSASGCRRPSFAQQLLPSLGFYTHTLQLRTPQLGMTAPSTDITALPDDVLLVIFEHLPTRTIAIARQVRYPECHEPRTRALLMNVQTCKAFQRVSHSKQLWLSVMRRDVLRNNLPVPAYCRHTDSLSGRECEVIVVNALCVSEHLRCGGSRPQAPHVVTAHQSRSVTWVKMIRGQWLLVACSDGSSSVLCLLSVALLSELGAAACPAAQTYLEGPVARGLVDVQETNRLVIAVELRAQSCVFNPRCADHASSHSPAVVLAFFFCHCWRQIVI